MHLPLEVENHFIYFIKPFITIVDSLFFHIFLAFLVHCYYIISSCKLMLLLELLHLLQRHLSDQVYKLLWCNFILLYVIIQRVKISVAFNWDSLHTRLNSHYQAWNYKKKKHKKDYSMQEICLERTYS